MGVNTSIDEDTSSWIGPSDYLYRLIERAPFACFLSASSIFSSA